MNRKRVFDETFWRLIWISLWTIITWFTYKSIKIFDKNMIKGSSRLKSTDQENLIFRFIKKNFIVQKIEFSLTLTLISWNSIPNSTGLHLLVLLDLNNLKKIIKLINWIFSDFPAYFGTIFLDFTGIWNSILNLIFLWILDMDRKITTYIIYF